MAAKVDKNKLPDVVDVSYLYKEDAEVLKALIDEGYAFSVRLKSVEGRAVATVVLKKNPAIHDISEKNSVDISDIELEDEE